jgi:ABC-type antimicrobial peptide transport system permease subunit
LLYSFLLFYLLFYLISQIPIVQGSPIPEIEIQYDSIIDQKNLFEHIDFLSNLGSRMTGYPGSRLAAEYISQKFRDYGLEVTSHKYRVLVPLEKQGSIEVISEGQVTRAIRAYALYPNLIQTSSTPPEGITGKLIFAGNGLKELSGKNLEGTIVLMDFNTGMDWINLAKLGAKAVIFIEPNSTDRMESMSKFLQTPLHFPRLYVSRDDGLYLIKALEDNRNLEVKVTLRMDYEWVEAENIIGMISGTEEPNDVIIVSSHYDSWSVVPSLSPAADEATSTAALIELSKYFSKHRPRRSIWFVAFSGHWQGLAGAREFVEDVILSSRLREGTLKIWMMMNLDFSTGSNRLSVVHTSDFYKINMPMTWENWLKSKFQTYVRSLEAETRKSFSNLIDISLQPVGWWARIPSPYIIDSDPMALVGSIAFTLRTSEDMRIHWGTPLNDLNKVSLDNLKTQITIAHYALLRFANETDWGISWDAVAPQRFLVSGIGAGRRLSGSGFVTLRGKVVEYNLTKGWFNPVPYALVSVRSSQTKYPFSAIVTAADENGTFSVHGLIPSFITDPPTLYTIDAWVLDDHDNHIKYASNLGLYGREINTAVSCLSPLVNATAAVFRCKSVVLFDVYDPRTLMKSQVLDQRGTLETFYSQPISILPYDFTTGAESLWYGRFYEPFEPIAMLFIDPEERFMIKIDYGSPVIASSFLVNSSSKWPEGYGYIFNDRNVIHISVPSQAALDIYTVTKTRYSEARSLLLRNLSLEKYLEIAEEHLNRYLQYRNSNMYLEADQEALITWSLSIAAYDLFMSLLYESSTTISTAVAIIIPAALFLERLLTNTTGYKRLLSLLILMIIMFSIFGLLFPGFNIMKIHGNPFILIITVALAYLLLFSSGLLFKVSSAAIKRRRKEKLGVHEFEREEFSFLLQSLTISIGHLKKHRLHTFLILTTIVIVSLSMTSLASLSPYVLTRMVLLEGVKSPRDGFLFKRYDTSSLQVIDKPLIDYLERAGAEGMFGEQYEIFPRVWVYPQTVLPQGDLISDVRSKYGSSKIQALIGLSGSEAELLFGKGLIGVNFRDEDTFTCLIPMSLSKTLNITVSDTISWNGIQFFVKGIFDETVVRETSDIDGYTMAPFDPFTVSAISHLPVQEGSYPTPIALHSLMVIPYKTALKLGGILVSVAVHSPKMKNISNVVNTLSLLNVHAYVGVNGSTYSLSRTTAYEFIGLEPILILGSLASLNILAIMLGRVNARKKEIMIYSALGLDPTSSVLLFLFETLVLSTIGITIGYLVGINLNYIFIAYNFLPATFNFNYSSTTVVIIILIILAFSLSSTIYPAYIASRIVTPSYERKWKVSTKPKDGEWEIPLPFILSKDEVAGLFRFLREFYENIGEDRLKTFTFTSKIEINLESETPSISSVVALAPLEANITQRFSLIAAPISEDQYALSILLKQLSGIELRSTWISANYDFIDSIRKQLLIWRSFSENEKKKYYAPLDA